MSICQEAAPGFVPGLARGGCVRPGIVALLLPDDLGGPRFRVKVVSGAEKGVKSFPLCGRLICYDERCSQMSKAMLLGVLILAGFIVVLIMTRDIVTVNLFSKIVTLKASYALLASAGVGMAVGALLRK
jgi:hypothetical protein